MDTLNVIFINSQNGSLRIQKRPALYGEFRFVYVISCVDKTFRYFWSQEDLYLLINLSVMYISIEQCFVELTTAVTEITRRTDKLNKTHG